MKDDDERTQRPGVMMSFNELRDALEEAWDQGNACGLDGYVGPGRGTEPIDDEAIYARDRDVDRIMHRCHKAAASSTAPTISGGARNTADTSSSRLSPTPTASPPNMCHTGQFRSTP